MSPNAYMSDMPKPKREHHIAAIIINNVNLSKNDIISVNVGLRQTSLWTRVIESDHSAVCIQNLVNPSFLISGQSATVSLSQSSSDAHLCNAFYLYKSSGK